MKQTRSTLFKGNKELNQNQTDKVITGLPTEHCKLNKHLNQLGLAEEEVWRFCQEEEDIAEHIVVLR